MAKHDDPQYWRDWYQTHKKKLNDEMRDRAEHYRERWDPTEHEMLMQWDGHGQDELAAIAEALGRTYMACQTRWYFYRNHPEASAPGEKSFVRNTSNNKPQPKTQPRWDPDDDPNGWYVKG